MVKETSENTLARTPFSFLIQAVFLVGSGAKKEEEEEEEKELTQQKRLLGRSSQLVPL